ncbi:GNAT family N-acetyltransferase [Sedimenticola thiotaurini]|uniref:GNAT family N-acetyltransferase n=1 Tax=Sedimenticola thiotaurini TaxID=1543721 RepID=UPI001F23672B|nr:GNAT family N-acetyltransferase [Sedimenticola thiotaurini]
MTLRTFREADWRDLHAYYSDPECTRHTVGKPLREAATWQVLASMIGHWEMRGYGPYAVVERASGRVIGPVGLWYPLDWPEPEIKWALARDYWGRGYALEAALAVREMAAEQLPDIRLISLIQAENRASIALAERIGAMFERTLAFRGGVWHLYRHQQQTAGEDSCNGSGATGDY